MEVGEARRLGTESRGKMRTPMWVLASVSVLCLTGPPAASKPPSEWLLDGQPNISDAGHHAPVHHPILPPLGAVLEFHRHREHDVASVPYRAILRRASAAGSLKQLDGEVTQHLYRLAEDASVLGTLNHYRRVATQSRMQLVFECHDQYQCGRDFGAFLSLSEAVIPHEFESPAAFDGAAALLAHGGDRSTEHYLFILLLPQSYGGPSLYQQLVRTPRLGAGAR